MLPEDERLEVYMHVRELLARVSEAISQGEDESNHDVQEPASKRSCLSLFQDWRDEDDDKAATDESEENPPSKKEPSCSGVSELCD